MPLYSDENRLRELERKVNRLLQDNRDLKQQVTQANQTARAIAVPQAQGGQQPTATPNPIRGAKVTAQGSPAVASGGVPPTTVGTLTCTVYSLSSGAPSSLATGITVVNTFTGTIANGTWILIALDDSGAYQVIAEQC